MSYLNNKARISKKFILACATAPILLTLAAFTFMGNVDLVNKDDYFKMAYGFEVSTEQKTPETYAYNANSDARISNYYNSKLSKDVNKYIRIGENLNEQAKSNENLISYDNSALVSRGFVDRAVRGEALDWWSEVKGKIINRDDILLIKDFQTGRSFKIAVEGGSNHADVEPLTQRDADIMKSLWGGNYSWERRPVLVFTKTKVIAASLNGMPHAGLDNQPYKAVVSSRSAGYGRGINYDMVKGNGVDGHMCLHFKNSTLHKNGKVDYKHQQAIKTASGQ